MATGTSEHLHSALRDEEHATMGILTAGSTSEAIGGAGAIVLAILGLAGIEPMYMLPIAVLAVGVALVLEGSAVISRFSDVAMRAADDRGERVELETGVTSQFLGGVAGIVLGILALIGIEPLMLCAIAVLVFGGAMLFGSGATARLRDLESPYRFENRRVERLSREATLAASGVELLVALAAIVLGILALTGIEPLTLPLVALLAIGSAIVISGSAVSSRVLNTFSR